MISQQRTSVGLDVHARSVVASGLDGETGQVFERRLTPDHGELFGWLESLPGPVAVCTAGPCSAASGYRSWRRSRLKDS